MSVLVVELILAVEFILRLAINVMVLLVILQIIFVRIIFVLYVLVVDLFVHVIVQLHVHLLLHLHLLVHLRLLFIVYLRNIVGVNVANAVHIRVHVYIVISFASVYRLPANRNIMNVNRVVIAHVNVVPIKSAVKLAIVSGRGVPVHAHNQNHILSDIFSIK
jgi:hypothetical protein